MRKFHRWVGLIFSVFIIVFCFSGIMLNHRHALRHVDVSRSWLPKSYGIKDWNNGIVRGTLQLGDSLLVYGIGGAWVTDSTMQSVRTDNAGIESGADCRRVSHVVMSTDSTLWLAAGYDAYCRRLNDSKWRKVDLPGHSERLSDVAVHADTIVFLSRSAAYVATAPQYKFSQFTLQAPEGYEPRVSLFKTVWMLHSGELFGIVGRIVVDIVAIVIIILCITGILFFFLPYAVRHDRRKGLKGGATRKAKQLAQSIKLHNKFGRRLIVLTTLIAITGTCLRPPLMIPLVMGSTSPLPFTAQDSPNPFADKLRAIRWDETAQTWYMSTSEGFYRIADLTTRVRPEAIVPSPPISPMGITVFEQTDSAQWLIGSFSGLFVWNPESASVSDYFTGKTYERPSGRQVGNHMVAGYSHELGGAVFEYDNGLPNLPMPEIFKSQPMSLWNFALELHVGRCYSPFLGPLSDLFVFIAGSLLTALLITGYILYNRSHKKSKKQ